MRFSTLSPDGVETNVREISNSDIAQCPHLIFSPDHYRIDGSCKCDDPDDPNMADWGYIWDGKAWR